MLTAVSDFDVSLITCSICREVFSKSSAEHYCYPQQDWQVSPQPEDPSQEGDLFDLELLESPPILPGATFYLLSKKWFSLWKHYVGLTTSSEQRTHPGPIFNDHLFEESVEGITAKSLKRSLEASFDYDLVDTEVWTHLQTWYGGGPAIPRKAVKVGIRSFEVELFPTTIHFFLMSKVYTKSFCKTTYLYEIKWMLSTEFSLVPHRVQLSLCTGTNEVIHVFAQEDLKTKTLDCFPDVMWMRLEYLATVSPQPSPSRTQNYANHTINALHFQGQESGTPVAIGIQNLGNTCYMNSVLQCLLHNPALVTYFLSGKYTANLNPESTTKGTLATQLAALVEKIWGGNFRKINPSEFRQAMNSFAPQFRGFHQHDAQEFLYFVLEGLNNDLAKEPPSCETKSYVTKLFEGQSASVTTCLSCKKEKRTEEIFTTLSIEVPSHNIRPFNLKFFPSLGIPVTCQLRVPKNGTVRHLKEAMSHILGPKSEKLVFKENFAHQILDISEYRELNKIRADAQVLAFENPGEIYEVHPECSLFKPFLISISPGDKNFTVYEKVGNFISCSLGLATMDLRVKTILPGPPERDSYFPPDWTEFLITPGKKKLKAVILDVPEEHATQTKRRQDNDSEILKVLGNLEEEEEEDLVVDLSTCLNSYFRKEHITIIQEWRCESCNSISELTKQIKLQRLPECLVIHLKRFEYNQEYRCKITTEVNFPERLSGLLPYFDDQVTGVEDEEYTLYAVVDHIGSLGGGHYTATCRMTDFEARNDADVGKARWYKLNDGNVSEITEQNLVTSGGYLLFYFRTGSFPKHELQLTEIVTGMQVAKQLQEEEEEVKKARDPDRGGKRERSPGEEALEVKKQKLDPVMSVTTPHVHTTP